MARQGRKNRRPSAIKKRGPKTLKGKILKKVQGKGRNGGNPLGIMLNTREQWAASAKNSQAGLRHRDRSQLKGRDFSI